MERIKIINTPPGQAPEWVRDEWVGLVLPLEENAPAEDEGIQMGTAGGKPENEDGYSVLTQDAIGVLSEKSLDAVCWWEDNLPLAFIPRFVFRKEVCELLPDTSTSIVE
jgi:hypothetical protein